MSTRPNFIGILSIIIATVALAVTFTFFAGYLDFGPNFEASIFPSIYSTENNIGVLNEEAKFELSVRNRMDSSQVLEIKISVTDELIKNETISISPQSEKNETITQKLTDVGMWKIEAFNQQTLLDSYTFKTVTNKIEADFELQALEESAREKNEADRTFLLGVATLLVTIVFSSIGVYYKFIKKSTETNTVN